MATHSSTLAWEIPWTEEPGRLQSMGLWRVGHNWVTSLSRFIFMNWRRKWQPTPVFLPGEYQGREPGGLPSRGLHRVEHDWSDLAAAITFFKKRTNGSKNLIKKWDTWTDSLPEKEIKVALKHLGKKAKIHSWLKKCKLKQHWDRISLVSD